MAQTAADILIETLIEDWGVRHIFSLPGDGINGIYEALRQRQDRVQLIQVRHEEAAAFAACAYAKFTGGLGVCLATSGPGAIHLLNGLYDAKLDGASVLAITGQTYHDLIGTFYQQEVDLHNLFADVSVYNHEVRSAAHVDVLVHEAVKAALSRRGVSHISFPNDLQEEPAPQGYVRRGLAGKKPTGHVSATWTRPVPVAPVEALDAAAEVLDAGERVAMLVGSGALGATAEVIQASERLSAPIVHAYLGKGVVPAAHPNHMGGVGLLGDLPGQLALEQCDTLLIVGSSFPYMNYYPEPGKARAVQIDIDPTRIGLRYPVEVGLPGDSRATLAHLLERLQPNTAGAEWLAQLQREKADWRKVLEKKAEDDKVPLKPQRVAWELNRHLPDNAILCGDSGTNTTWFSRYLDVRPGMLASGSGNLATMASGFPYAIGAQVAFPERRAVAFVGDGAFTMLMGEMLTAVKYELPLVVVMIRNDYFGQIRWEQMAFVGNPEFGVALHNPRSFADWATNCGGQGFHVTRPEELEPAFRAAFQKTDGPTLVECVVDPDEAPLPPKIPAEHALNFMKAMARGQPNPVRIGLTMFRDKVDELLVQGIGKIPGPQGAEQEKGEQ
ncbi:MAG: thiamine pyrophosphate-binding protein [Gemmatimonadota bacterium]|nr:thiamine pyrophosphate-binding protein [Gemmatimonadota bacterium]